MARMMTIILSRKDKDNKDKVVKTLKAGTHVLGARKPKNLDSLNGASYVVFSGAAGVSGSHLRLVVTEDSCTIEDMKSRNGSHLNGTALDAGQVTEMPPQGTILMADYGLSYAIPGHPDYDEDLGGTVLVELDPEDVDEAPTISQYEEEAEAEKPKKKAAKRASPAAAKAAKPAPAPKRVKDTLKAPKAKAAKTKKKAKMASPRDSSGLYDETPPGPSLDLGETVVSESEEEGDELTVWMTGYHDDAMRHQVRDRLQQLGAEVERELFADDTEVIVAPKVMRTPRFMTAYVGGIPAVDGQKWIAASLKRGRLVDYEPYRLLPKMADLPKEVQSALSDRGLGVGDHQKGMANLPLQVTPTVVVLTPQLLQDTYDEAGLGRSPVDSRYVMLVRLSAVVASLGAECVLAIQPSVDDLCADALRACDVSVVTGKGDTYPERLTSACKQAVQKELRSRSGKESTLGENDIRVVVVGCDGEPSEHRDAYPEAVHVNKHWLTCLALASHDLPEAFATDMQ
ncbi:hypothetical protein KIPB_007169 [Kipferlia bialata]|uniref:FHA domain-containing protein n=1 Tax=Kipferlia bialata TaxID=797122 RepID=A0A9K3CY61_9EUKA|nr:hypothetical protein KIPB_007169 [Kipferlia bialata]|eukprot:g7169.t1